MINQEILKQQAENIYMAWDKTLASNDVDSLLELYAEDAIIESPIIPYLLKTDTGILRGKNELKSLLEIVAERKPFIQSLTTASDGKEYQTKYWQRP